MGKVHRCFACGSEAVVNLYLQGVDYKRANSIEHYTVDNIADIETMDYKIFAVRCMDCGSIYNANTVETITNALDGMIEKIGSM